jgi:hypothetical protein
MIVGCRRINDVGNLLVRWRGPTEPAFGDVIVRDGQARAAQHAGLRPACLPRPAPRHIPELQATFPTSRDRRPASAASRPGFLATQALNSAVDPPHAAMLMGIVLGIKHGIPTELEQALIATGLIHLLVLSGLKVAVFAHRPGRAEAHPWPPRTWPVLGLIALYRLVEERPRRP